MPLRYARPDRSRRRCWRPRHRASRCGHGPVLEERCVHPAFAQLLAHACLDEAAHTRLVAAVRHGAAAQDGSGDQSSRARRMGNQFAEMELHLLAGLWTSELPVVEPDFHRAVQLAAAPMAAQFVGRDEHRRQRGGRLGLDEAEALGQFGHHQRAQGNVVDQAQQPDMSQGLLCVDAQRNVTGHHDHLRLEVDPQFLAGRHDVIARADEVVRGALVHHGIGEEGRRHFAAARAASSRHG